jgi:hypothetical protein
MPMQAGGLRCDDCGLTTRRGGTCRRLRGSAWCRSTTATGESRHQQRHRPLHEQAGRGMVRGRLPRGCHRQRTTKPVNNASRNDLQSRPILPSGEHVQGLTVRTGPRLAVSAAHPFARAPPVRQQLGRWPGRVRQRLQKVGQMRPRQLVLRHKSARKKPRGGTFAFERRAQPRQDSGESGPFTRTQPLNVRNRLVSGVGQDRYPPVSAARLPRAALSWGPSKVAGVCRGQSSLPHPRCSAAPQQVLCHNRKAHQISARRQPRCALGRKL